MRPNVVAAIQECYTAGIRVVMITGDYPGTAQTIARQIGLMQMGAILTGSELDLMSEAELDQRIQKTSCINQKKNPTPPFTYVKISPPRLRGGVLRDFCKRSKVQISLQEPFPNKNCG